MGSGSCQNASAGGFRVAVLQSNYVPWRGYFDIIHDVDLFVFYDEVQYTKNDWRNRNRIITPRGTQWLTVPVYGSTDKEISEIEIVPGRWGEKHYQALLTNYGKAPYFDRYKGWLKDIYHQNWKTLSELNQTLIRTISREYLEIGTRFAKSTEFTSHGKSSEKLLSLLRSIGATSYVSGPAAQSYMDLDAFSAAGIEVIWKDYHGYPAYEQLHEPFDPYVSILDVLFNTGPRAAELVWKWRQASGKV